MDCCSPLKQNQSLAALVMERVPNQTARQRAPSRPSSFSLQSVFILFALVAVFFSGSAYFASPSGSASGNLDKSLGRRLHAALSTRDVSLAPASPAHQNPARAPPSASGLASASRLERRDALACSATAPCPDERYHRTSPNNPTDYSREI